MNAAQLSIKINNLLKYYEEELKDEDFSPEEIMTLALSLALRYRITRRTKEVTKLKENVTLLKENVTLLKEKNL